MMEQTAEKTNCTQNSPQNKFKINWDEEAMTGYFNNNTFAEQLRKDFFIIAEPIGTPKTSRRQNKILTKPFVLSKYEVFYLLEK